MSLSRDDFLRGYFLLLESKGISYVILHGYEGFPASVESDVDYCVLPGCESQAVRLMRDFCGASGWRWVQSIRHESSALYNVCVRAGSREYVQLDLCTDYRRKGRFLVPAVDLLKESQIAKGIRIPSAKAEFTYLLAKMLAKPLKTKVRIDRLKELWERDREGCRKSYQQYLELEAGESFPITSNDIPRLRRIFFGKHARSWKDMISEAGRLIRRVVNPTGVWIVFLGTDGSGKSAVISRLEPLLMPFFRRIFTGHFRPHLWVRSSADGGATQDPHGRKPRSRFLSFFKLAYYLLDAWAGYLIRIIPAKIQSTCVLYDRWLMDIAVDGYRYRLGLPKAVLDFFSRVVPSPDFVFCLDAPVEILRSRKQELTEEETSRQRDVYRKMAGQYHGGHIIDASASIDDVAVRIGEILFETMETRTKACFDRLYPDQPGESGKRQEPSSGGSAAL